MKAKIKSIIENHGTVKIARTTGYTRQYVWMVLKNKANPGRDFIKKFCDAYNAKPNDFF